MFVAILDRRPHKVDDGWWSGRVIPSGEIGTFASLMVRELSAKEVTKKSYGNNYNQSQG